MNLQFVVGVSVDMEKWATGAGLSAIANGITPVMSVRSAIEKSLRMLTCVDRPGISVIVVTGAKPRVRRAGRVDPPAKEGGIVVEEALPVAATEPAKRKRGRPRKAR